MRPPTPQRLVRPWISSQRQRAGTSQSPSVRVFDEATGTVPPFLAFPPMLRRVIHTTNSIESLNYQLRKVTKTAAISLPVA